MASVIPRFNMRRVVSDYAAGMYLPTANHAQKLLIEGGAPAQQLSQWKQRVRERWDGVRILEVRLYPWHPLLTHPLEMGLLKSL
jgi:glycogen phosphorylase